MSEQLARDHRHAVFVHATGRHALMRTLDDDRDAARLEHVLNTMGDLGRQRLLDLQAPRERLDGG